MIFEELVELKPQMFTSFVVGIKRSQKTGVCVQRNVITVVIIPLMTTSSVFDNDSFAVHGSLHVEQTFLDHSYSTFVWRILRRRLTLKAYRIKLVQVLLSDDKQKRIDFCNFI